MHNKRVTFKHKPNPTVDWEDIPGQVVYMTGTAEEIVTRIKKQVAKDVETTNMPTEASLVAPRNGQPVTVTYEDGPWSY